MFDNAVYQTASAPPPFCEGNLLTNGDFASGVSSDYGYNYGTVVSSVDGGVDGSSAAALGDGSAGAGIGQQGVALDGSSDAYELNFAAQRVASAQYQNLKLTVKDAGGATLEQAEINLRSSSLANYRLVVSADDPAAATIGFTLDIGAGDETILDNLCLLPTTITPPTPVAGNLVTNGDFENGSAFTNSVNNLEVANDPSTGLKGIVGSGSYNSGQTDAIPVTAGETYELQADIRSTGFGYAKVNITWFDANNVQIGGREDNLAQNPTAEYATYTFEVTAPSAAPATSGGQFRAVMMEDAAFARIQVEAGGGTGGVAAFDNLSFVPVAPVPVQLAALDAAPSGAVNVISWTTASEINTATFLVERSADGVADWSTVAEVAPKGGASETASYEVRDASPIANAYYRLRSLDFDGAEEISRVLNVARLVEGSDLKAYPNPVADLVTIDGDFGNAEEYGIFDVTGRIVLSGAIAPGVGRLSVSTDALPAGQYYVRIGSATLKLVK